MKAFLLPGQLYAVPLTDIRGGDVIGTAWIRPLLGWQVKEEVTSLSPSLRARWAGRFPGEPPRELQGTVGRHGGGLLALISAARELDDRDWLHVSISRPDRIPSYEDLVLAKRGLVGATRKAIQVFPPEKEHVSDHDFCLHLWAPLTDDPLPDFTRGNRTI